MYKQNLLFFLIFFAQIFQLQSQTNTFVFKVEKPEPTVSYHGASIVEHAFSGTIEYKKS